MTPGIDDIDEEIPERRVSIVALATGFARAVAIALALGATGLYLSAAARLASAEDSKRTCEMQAARLDAQLKQYDKWLLMVRDGKRPAVGGVGGGP